MICTNLKKLNNSSIIFFLFYCRFKKFYCIFWNHFIYHHFYYKIPKKIIIYLFFSLHFVDVKFLWKHAHTLTHVWHSQFLWKFEFLILFSYINLSFFETFWFYLFLIEVYRGCVPTQLPQTFFNFVFLYFSLLLLFSFCLCVSPLRTFSVFRPRPLKTHRLLAAGWVTTMAQVF